MFIADIVSGGMWNSVAAVFVYALILQLRAPHPDYAPLYHSTPGPHRRRDRLHRLEVSIGQGPSVPVLRLFSAVVTLFGAKAPASAGGLLLYAVIVIVKKIRELVVR